MYGESCIFPTVGPYASKAPAIDFKYFSSNRLRALEIRIQFLPNQAWEFRTCIKEFSAHPRGDIAVFDLDRVTIAVKHGFFYKKIRGGIDPVDLDRFFSRIVWHDVIQWARIEQL